jgi:DNA-binding transcriptional MerR regulator
MGESHGFQIGQIAQRSGLTVDTIRFYEKQSLLAKPPRTIGGFRLYTDGDLDRLNFIVRAQSLGFSLHEIGELLVLRDSGPDACTHVRNLLGARLRDVESKIKDLPHLERQLKQAQKQCDEAAATDCSPSCPLLERLDGKGRRSP